MRHPAGTLLFRQSRRAREDYAHVKQVFRGDGDVPKNFDGRDQWKDLLGPVEDQGMCGSCWAFAGCHMLADRLAIITDGAILLTLSKTKMVLCDFGGDTVGRQTGIPNDQPAELRELNAQVLKGDSPMGCNGNTLAETLLFLYRWGTPEENCGAYNYVDDAIQKEGGGTSQPLPLCQDVFGDNFDTCSSGRPMRLYRLSDVYAVPGEMNIMREIMANGPVISGYTLFEDFYYWDGAATEVYVKGEGQEVGGHAIEIVGWGEDDGVKYWLIRNTWGSGWGDGGYFKIERGFNGGEIESQAMAGTPDVANLIEGAQPQEAGSDVISGVDRQLRDRWPLTYGYRPRQGFAPGPLISGDVTLYIGQASDVVGRSRVKWRKWLIWILIGGIVVYYFFIRKKRN